MVAREPRIAVFVDNEYVAGDAVFSPRDTRFNIVPAPSTLVYWQHGNQDFEARNEYFFLKNAMWLSRDRRRGLAFIGVGVPVGDHLVQLVGSAQNVSYGNMVSAEEKMKETLKEKVVDLGDPSKAEIKIAFGELFANPAPVFKGRHNPSFKPIVGAKFVPIDVSVPGMDEATIAEIETGPIYDSSCMVKCPPGASQYPCVKPLQPFCDIVYCNTNKRVEYDHKLAEFLRGAFEFIEPVSGKSNERYAIVDFDVVRVFSGSTKQPPRDFVEFGMSREGNLSRFSKENPLFKFAYRIMPSSDDVPDEINFPAYSAVISVKSDNYRIMLCKKSKYGKSAGYLLNLPLPEPTPLTGKQAVRGP